MANIYNMLAANTKGIKKAVITLGDLLNIDEEDMKKATRKLTNFKPVDVTVFEEFKNHCTGCQKPNESCKAQREAMQKYNSELDKGITEYIGKALATIPALFE
jgi:hypothetical protein